MQWDTSNCRSVEFPQTQKETTADPKADGGTNRRGEGYRLEM